MTIYTVHEPPAANRPADPDRYVFVRDGFHFWAFLLGPAWMIWRGLWLVLLCYALALLALAAGLQAAKVPNGAAAAIGFLMALLTGFEASTLRRWTLRRRGFAEVAAVVGDDVESAERRFFAGWNGSGARPAAVAASPMRMPRGAAQDVVGFFPEPGGSR